MLTRLRLLTAGESHGPGLTAILEGVPAGLELDIERIDADLARRQRGPGSGERMQIEKDRASITGGVMAGRTTGAPLCLAIENLDHASWKVRNVEPMVTPRPGHADLVGALKYGHRDLRPSLERASARETAARVAAGAVCRQILAAFGIDVGAYVRSIGTVTADLEDTGDVRKLAARIEAARSSDTGCPDPAASERMGQIIEAAAADGDTLGGIVEVAALGIPPGLGSYAQWDRKLEARLAMALVSIQAMKGVEFGPAFDSARRRGTEVHDEIFATDGRLLRRTNRAGGIEAGVSTGSPILARVAMKPISTTRSALRSVDLLTGRAAPAAHERSDVCAVTRAAVVVEAMMALVLADALVEKLGGDSLEEMRPRFESLRRAHLDDLELEGKPYRP
jgi:chorismate synthase